MKIGLINLYSTRNIGDAAIYAALTRILHKHDVSALTDSSQFGTLQGAVVEPVNTVCDAYVSVGGDIFNNSRPWLATRTFLGNLTQLMRNNKQTILFGQSIPRSCHGLAFNLLCQGLKTLPSVTVRDKESWERLQKAGVNAHLSYDLAFVHRPTMHGIHAAGEVLSHHRLTPERTVLLSLRRFDMLYPHDNKRFVDNMALLCLMLLNADLQPALLLQSEAEGDDLDVAKAIRDKVPGIPFIDALDHPEQIASYEFLQGLLAIAGLAVGVRYHTSVLALAAGRMPYNLYYSNKGQDLCGRLAVPGCDLADFNPQHGIGALLDCLGQDFDDNLPRASVENSLPQALQSLPAALQLQVAS
jgi:polysaccharide pyruvyl transferase WcaK-like protein